MDKGLKPGPDTSDFREKAIMKKMMTADQCAQVILRAARRRQREVVMARGALAVWLKLIAPGLVDRLTVAAFLAPARRRVAQAQNRSSGHI